ncbi:hypothetical protein NOVOSPHI9U_70247 [Novosphingobium sp. 9U]|nr:hypothetical protein NOVOSPHI9U_70247 [Novosphingobium sp. 9U]
MPNIVRAYGCVSMSRNAKAPLFFKPIIDTGNSFRGRMFHWYHHWPSHPPPQPVVIRSRGSRLPGRGPHFVWPNELGSGLHVPPLRRN